MAGSLSSWSRFGCTNRILLVAKKPVGMSWVHGEPPVCLILGRGCSIPVIRCGVEHSIKLDVKIRIVPTGTWQYYCPLNLLAFNLGSVSAVLL